jgi:glutamate decarboxylase
MSQVISARDPVPMLPLCTFSLKPEYRMNGFDEFDVADRLRQRGWVVPAYTMAPDAQVGLDLQRTV